MSLERLSLRNFQAHRKLDLELDPAVTTIIGRSDAGKSAILRALRWIATNEPAGVAFVRRGATRAVAGLSVDGRKVVRKRGKGKNTYVLDGRALKAFGGGVPGDVAALLNVDAVNFQGQYDHPFWLAESSGEVSRQLNRIVSLEIIDKTLSKLASMERGTAAEVRVIEQRVDEATEQRRLSKYAKRMDAELKLVEGLGEERDRLVAEMESLEGICMSVLMQEGLAEQANEKLTDAEAVLAKGKRWEEQVELCSELELLLFEADVRGKGASRKIPDITEVEVVYQKLNDVKKRCVELSSLVTEATALERQCNEADAGLAADEDRIRNQMGEVCPLCGK